MSADVERLHHVPEQARLLLKDEAYLKIKTLLLQENPEQTHSERALAASLNPGLGLSVQLWSDCALKVSLSLPRTAAFVCQRSPHAKFSISMSFAW